MKTSWLEALANRKAVILSLIIAGALLRLPLLSYPNSVVFDEVTFGKYINDYCGKHERFFDIHPPHAKLLIAGVARALGYRGTFVFDHIGQAYGDTPVWKLRLVPALSGILLPVLVFLLLEHLGASMATATVGAMLILLDNAYVVQTKIIALDGILTCAIMGSLVCWFVSTKRSHLRRLFWCVGAGGCAGLAVGSKFTGLIAPAVLGILVSRKWVLPGAGRNIREGLREFSWLGFGFFVVYFLGWEIHFALLKLPGYADSFYRLTGNFMWDLVHMHKVMLLANNGITTVHPDQSPWWSWPLMKRPIFYWSAPNEAIYFLGNPAVWWGITFVFFAVPIWHVIRVLTGRESQTAFLGKPFVGVLLAAYAISVLPYIPVARGLFMYHYLPALVFSIIAASLWAERLGWIFSKSLLEQRRLYYLTLAVVIFTFILISPATYGFRVAGAPQRVIAELTRYVH